MNQIRPRPNPIICNATIIRDRAIAGKGSLTDNMIRRAYAPIIWKQRGKQIHIRKGARGGHCLNTNGRMTKFNGKNQENKE